MCFLALSRNSDLRRLLSPSVSPYKLVLGRSHTYEQQGVTRGLGEGGKGGGEKGGGEGVLSSLPAKGLIALKQSRGRQ